MSSELAVLLIEDSEDDAVLLLRALRKGGHDPVFQRVDTMSGMKQALETGIWDVVIADYSLPHFSGLEALRMVKEKGLDLPFIIVSGAIGENVAVAAMRAGAHDYIMKANLARLAPAIERELQEAALRREHRRSEEALLRTQKMESLGLLAGGVAHDFNNLLVAMLGQSSLALAKLPPQSAAREHIRKSVQAAERAADITRQMLAFAGRGQFELRAIDLNILIQENLHLLELAVPKHVKLTPRLQKDLPMITADPGQMQQIIMNLILNGAEAIGEDAGTVVVSTGTQRGEPAPASRRRFLGSLAGGEAYVTLQVQDTGAGMDAATLKQIFDPFFTTKKSGRGLGLAAVQGIVRAHKGALHIDSELGKGTVFRLFFPVSADEPAPSDEVVSQVETQPKLVLVIDDEFAVLDAVTDILALAEIETITASNGRQGLTLYSERHAEIDLVLLDLTMPGLSGYETLAQLRQIKSEVRVILSSGYNQIDVTDRLNDPGRVGFLQKPYDADKLINVVRQFMKT